MTVSFSMTFHKKTCKAEVLFNLMYASDQLIKGVSWRSVKQICAWAVLRLDGMKKKQQTADG